MSEWVNGASEIAEMSGSRLLQSHGSDTVYNKHKTHNFYFSNLISLSLPTVSVNCFTILNPTIVSSFPLF